jgi:nucleoside phosphorylase
MAESTSGAAPGRPQAVVVVLTALLLEYNEVRPHLRADCAIKKLKDGTIYEISPYAGEHIDWTVAVAEIGAGNESAAIEATTAIAEFQPDLLVFVGVAGSLKPDDAPHGSVVVAETVWGYHGGKDSEEFVPRGVSEPPRLRWRLSCLSRSSASVAAA